MQDDPNEDAVKEEIKNANLPQFPDLSQIKKELTSKAQANLHHTPRQRGPYLVCISCEYEHTLAYIGPFKKMVGINDKGEPIFKDLTM